MIPIGPAPNHIADIFVLLSELVLEACLGFLSQTIYLIMDAVGLPVFASFAGGIIYLYGPTRRYLLAFPIVALLVGWIGKKKDNLINYLVASFVGVIINTSFRVV